MRRNMGCRDYGVKCRIIAQIRTLPTIARAGQNRDLGRKTPEFSESRFNVEAGSASVRRPISTRPCSAQADFLAARNSIEEPNHVKE